MQTRDAGAPLLRARLRKGWNQRIVAAAARCSQNTISLLETGKMRGCSEDLAKTLALIFERDLEDLFIAHPGSRVQRATNAVSRTRQARKVAA